MEGVVLIFFPVAFIVIIAVLFLLGRNNKYRNSTKTIKVEKLDPITTTKKSNGVYDTDLELQQIEKSMSRVNELNDLWHNPSSNNKTRQKPKVIVINPYDINPNSKDKNLRWWESFN